MTRVSFYVDGFNIYHVIKQYCPKCKWLNLRKMLRSVVPESFSIIDIYYFSALAYWKADRVKRHTAYIKALEAENIKIVLGRFKKKDRLCANCRKIYLSHEEKHTDVNIALRIFEDCMDDRFDSAILVSGDTDFTPVITTIKRRFPAKRIGIMCPIGAHAKELKGVADFFIKMKKSHLEKNQFPQIVDSQSERIEIPLEWK